MSTGRAQSTFGTPYTTGTFNYSSGTTDLVFKWHGFSLLAEALLREANKKTSSGTDAAGATLVEYAREGWGYFVQGGQMLTHRLEVVARWDVLYAADGTDPDLENAAKTRGRQVGCGLNYYLNGHFLKLQTDYHEIYGTRTTYDIRRALRVQLDAIF